MISKSFRTISYLAKFLLPLLFLWPTDGNLLLQLQKRRVILLQKDGIKYLPIGTEK